MSSTGEIANRISIVVNGQSRSVAGDSTVGELVVALNLAGRAIAVEVNDRLIPRDQFSKTSMKANDMVEIVTLAGGG